VLPLLGLVLFGDPKVANRFYREDLTVAMDRLADAWRELAVRSGHPVDLPDLSARAVMGVALMLALESRHAPSFDLERSLRLASEGTIRGFFPDLPIA
jgi:hypothetical protein